MATLTVYSKASDGYGYSSSTTYSTARAGSGLIVYDTSIVVGQELDDSGWYTCWEGFVQFDTSSIPDGNEITSANCYLYLWGDLTDTDFVQELRVYDWGATLEIADWVAGADLGNHTLLASKTVSPSAGYNQWVSSTNFKAAINKAGDTRLIFNSNRHRLGTAPSGKETTYWRSSEEAGTTEDPKLTVEYSTVTPIDNTYLLWKYLLSNKRLLNTQQ